MFDKAYLSRGRYTQLEANAGQCGGGVNKTSVEGHDFDGICDHLARLLLGKATDDLAGEAHVRAWLSRYGAERTQINPFAQVGCPG